MWISHGLLKLLELTIVRFQDLKHFSFFAPKRMLIWYTEEVSPNIIWSKGNYFVNHMFLTFSELNHHGVVPSRHSKLNLDIGKTESIWCITLTAACLHPLATNIILVFSINGTQNEQPKIWISVNAYIHVYFHFLSMVR